MIKINNILILLLLVLASLLRLFFLTEYPSGFHIDEVTLGYNSYLLLHTLKDETGKVLPLYSQSFGLDRALGNFLLVAGSEKLFGLTELAIRLPFAIFGIGSVFLMYLLSLKFLRKRLYALIVVFVITISPWHISIVRASSEASVSLFLILLSHYLFFNFLEEKRIKFLLTSLFSLILSIFFYHAAFGYVLILLPAIGIFILFTLPQEKMKLFSLLGVIGITVLLLIYFFLSRGGATRLDQVGFHKDTKVIMEQQKMFFEEGSNSVSQARFYHNKVVTYIRAMLNNYSEYFSLSYLFTQGGLPPRYTAPAMGLLYLFEIPLLLYGLYKLFSKDVHYGSFLALLLITSPFVAATTYEYSPNVQRSFFMLPYLILIVGIGLYYSIKKAQNNKIFIILIVFFVFLNTHYFMHQYFKHFPVHNPLYRNDGAKELVSYVTQKVSKYNRIFITNSPESPYYYFFFYNKLDPQKFHNLYSQIRNSPVGWLYEKKIFFTTFECPSFSKELPQLKNALYIDSGECKYTTDIETDFHIEKEILRKDNSVAYRLLIRKEE